MESKANQDSPHDQRIRVCAAQYRFRDMHGWEEFAAATAYFAETAGIYEGDFLVFPEMFTAQLLSFIPGENHLQEIHGLARFTDAYLELMTRQAQEHGLFIVGGSHPVLRDGQIYNVAHLFTPSGAVFSQDKLHPTPYECEKWQMRPGSGLTVFQTPLARIAIQVCYDVEFPEPTRLLAEAGADILFVPYSTDDRQGHNRVTFCARARAIENAIYVVTSGNVGTIRNRSYVLNYAESAVFTPSDFGFPPEAEAGRADPHVETVVVADLDMGALIRNRRSGSTRPRADRRHDLYEIRGKIPVRKIQVD